MKSLTGECYGTGSGGNTRTSLNLRNAETMSKRGARCTPRFVLNIRSLEVLVEADTNVLGDISHDDSLLLIVHPSCS